MIYVVVLICISLLTASCGEPATPTLEQSTSTTAPEQTAESPTSNLKISPGQNLRFETISLEEGLSRTIKWVADNIGLYQSGEYVL